jgi:hypothetical protein
MGGMRDAVSGFITITRKNFKTNLTPKQNKSNEYIYNLNNNQPRRGGVYRSGVCMSLYSRIANRMAPEDGKNT